MRGEDIWVGGFETGDLFWHVVDPDHAKLVVFFLFFFKVLVLL